MAALPDTVMPQVSLKTLTVAAGTDEERDVMMMVVETAVTHYEFLIADATNYRETAAKIADGMTRAGTAMKRQTRTRLIEAKGMPDGITVRKRDGKR